MIKGLVVLAVAMCLGGSIHVELGAFDPAQKTWRGYNPVCDKQCESRDGTICGTNVR